MPEFWRRMGDRLKNGSFDRDIEQAITALKKGARLLKYGRRGKPKFCPFRLSVDESALIWYVGKVEKQLILTQVSKIIPGQRTAVFQRYPQPDKEYQSFSLIYKDRSLDVICKDKDEAEIWLVGLKALTSGGNYSRRIEPVGDRTSNAIGQGIQTSIGGGISNKDSGDIPDLQIPFEDPAISCSGKVFSNAIFYDVTQSSNHTDSLSSSLSLFSSGGADNSNGRSSCVDNVRVSASSVVSSSRVSASSAVSSSSHGSISEDFDTLSDVFFWGEVSSDGVPGDGLQNVRSPFASIIDTPLPKQLQAVILLDVQHVACGGGYAALVTKQGEVYSWGEELGGRLGHCVDAYVSHPKRIDSLSDMNIQFVACGEYHTCAVTLSGDLYTWGDGIHNCGRVGHGSEASHWIPKLVIGPLEGLLVSSVSCGPWHTAIITYAGQLFTFGDGTFGALGHGDHRNMNIPREVEALRGFHTLSSACGVWHTAAIVYIGLQTSSSDNSPSAAKLFTWGDGDKGRLGHGDREPRLVPACVNTLDEPNFCQVACGQDITIALTTAGRVYTMGSSVYGQLGNPEADVKFPTCVEGKLHDNFVEEIACGSYHIAVLTSTTEVYTWGKGTNGQLGHGDNDDRGTPTLVEALKGKQVKKIVCGPNFTAVISVHKRVSSDDLSICSGCRLPFSYRRKRHNCYNCGLVFCNLCSSRKSVKATLAPNIQKPYRVCDECYNKIKKTMGCGVHSQIPKYSNGSQNQVSGELPDKETLRSRLSSLGSFKGESRRWQKSETNIRGLSPIPNERSQSGSIPNTFYQSSNRMFSASVQGSKIASRSTSPVSNMLSPRYSTSTSNLTHLRSPSDFADYSTKTNESMREAVSLHLQIEDLAHKSRLMEAELEKTSKQFQEATAIAGEEAAKCNAAKEVIKSLTVQLKDMAERVAEEYVIHADGTLTEELVEPDEPGVFVAASSNPGGERYLARVHFSRKQFNKQQAEKWWADNKQRLLQKHKSPAGERYTCNHSSARKREMID